jgi:predicted NAD/FAD-binding protein
MRVAIVGSGIAGLVAAHRLHPAHDVELFEAGSWIGGHTHTVTVELGGREFDVDTGFIVYNERNYPHFDRLLRELGVATQPTEMSFGLRSERTGVEYSGDSLGGLFAQPRNLLRPSHLRMLIDALRFFRAGRELLDRPGEDPRLGDWLDQQGYSRAFCDEHLLPMAGAIWSSEPGALRDFPARSLLRFYDNHGLLSLDDRPQWRVVKGGSARYVEALAKGFRERIRLDCPVARVARDGASVEIVTADGAARRFDAVVLACHSDQALAILERPSPLEREILGAIRYQPNEVVLHTDASLLPRSPRARAGWNYRVPRVGNGRVTVTYDMNRLQGIESPEPLLVTLNQTDAIAEDRILGRWEYAHPIFDSVAMAAQARAGEIQGAGHSYFAGAYWGYGFHEDGVRSALDALAAFERIERVERTRSA